MLEHFRNAERRNEFYEFFAEVEEMYEIISPDPFLRPFLDDYQTLTEFYQVALRKKLYRTIDELQTDLDGWIRSYNTERTHQGRWCYDKTPMHTFVDTLPLAKEKLLQAA